MLEGRLGAVAGIVFVVLFVAGNLLVIDMPLSDESESEIVEYYEDSTNQTLHVLAAYAFTLAGLAFVAFVRLGLRDRLYGRVGSQTAGAADLGVMGAVLAAAGFAIGGVGLGAVAAGQSFQDVPVDAGVAQFLAQVGYGAMLVVGGLASAFTIVAFSWAGQRTRLMPSWLIWLGYVAAVILLAALIFIPVILLPIWVLVTSIWLLRPGTAAAPATDALAT